MTHARFEAFEEPRRRSRTWALLITMAAMLIAAAVWAHRAEIEEVATGFGRVVPAQQTQTVQSLEGGIVREIMVREGERVTPDQILMRIDDTGFSSKVGELSRRRSALEGEVARLTAETRDAQTVTFPNRLVTEAPDVIQSERALFEARREKLATDLRQLSQQKTQRQQELAELDARRRKAIATLDPVQRELSLNRGLLARGNVAQVEVLRLERQVADLQGELQIVTAALPRARAAIEEVDTRTRAAESLARVQSGERLQASRSELAIIEETLKGATDRVTRTTVRAPARGTVNRVTITTLGAVIQPGQTLIEITPDDDTLLVEARIRPKDIAFITLNQPASIKLSAFDFMLYGALPGRVVRIGSDSLKDERGEPFYQVMVKTDRKHLGSAEKPLAIIPGLVGSIDIQTGQRTVLAYLLKPFARARSEALRER
jgi:membrane fusion protein, adhesin transport system